MSKHCCSYVFIVPWNNIQKPLLLSFFSMQRRLWRVCTFAQAHLSLRHSTEISCAGSNGDLCTVYKNSECCGEAADSSNHGVSRQPSMHCINASKNAPSTL